MSADSGGSMFAWSSLELAASDARKAEGASAAAELIPRPRQVHYHSLEGMLGALNVEHSDENYSHLTAPRSTLFLMVCISKQQVEFS